MNIPNRYRYATARYLRKIANRIASKNSPHGITFANIGAESLPKNAPRALVIYVTAGIERWLRGVSLDDPFFNKHTMHWESVEMVRQLNSRGYIVDYIHHRNTTYVDWTRYALIIDQWDNLKNVPLISGQKKVHYCTYIHWLPWNLGEHTRIRWFKEHTGIVVPWNRTMTPIMSDLYADYLTYFGTKTQADSFDSKPSKYQLDISAVYEPPYSGKNIETARKNFLWLGGGGLIHKGLDIAMEAIAKVPEANLYIAGNLEDEKQFWKWAGPFLKKHTNLHALGWVDVGSSKFSAIAERCISVLYPSAAEGGPGSVAQAVHWGLIPIVTKSALVRAESLGKIIDNTSRESMIHSASKHIHTIMLTPINQLREQCSTVAEFAHSTHTRSAYSKSFSGLLELISP